MMTRKPSSSEIINIAAISKKIDVDNRFSLRIYLRIADNILKQANIFRAENNVIDLYVMLLRFSSLVTETIPSHREYRSALESTKIYLKKKLLNALSELEKLKPVVQKKLEEINRKQSVQVKSQTQNSNTYSVSKAPLQVSPYVYNGSRTQQISAIKPMEDQFRKFALSIPPPKEETLSRHSIFGPNGLRGQWQAPSLDKGVCYPSNLDLTPVEIPRFNTSIEDESPIQKEKITPEQEKITPEEEKITSESVTDLKIENPNRHFEELSSLTVDIIKQPSPPPVLAEVQDLMPSTGVESEFNNISSDGLVVSEAPLQLHISTALMENFMNLAKKNTDKNLETCGILAGTLKNRKFYITALIIPKQESTSDSCNATNEEEIFEVQDKQSLFPLGWIHTHPTQSCFMSSVDVHTQYSYQIMLPESIAIVMAPRDTSRKCGIFRLTKPGGMTVIRQCPRRGFHSHDPTSDGSPIYDQCTDVYMDSKLKFQVIDLR